MEIVLAAIILIGIGVFGMCFNVIFRKNGEFPETEVGHNKDMKKLGIKCARVSELALRKKLKREAMAKAGCDDVLEEDCLGDCNSCA